MAESDVPARVGRAAVAVALLLGLALMGAPVVVGWFLDGDQAHFATRVAVTAAAIVATCSAAQAARREVGSLRWGWALLAAAATCWSVSNLLAAYGEVVRGRALPVPSPADVPAGAAVLFSALAVLSFLGAVLPPAARMRTLLDGLLIASSLVFLAWALVLQDLYVITGEGVGRAFALAYPLSDVALVALLVLSLTRLRLTRPWLFLMAAFGLHSVSHAAFAYLEVARAYNPGLESVTWIAGTLALAVAALPAKESFERRTAAPRGGTRADVLVPCIPLALCVFIAARQFSDGPLSPFLLVNGGIILVLLVARQLLAQVEYLDLYRQLEASVMHALDVLTVVGPDGRIRQQTGPAERTLGHQAGDLVGTPFSDLIHPNGREEVLSLLVQAPPPPAPPAALQLLLRRGDGGWALTETTVADLRDHPDVRGYLVTSRDVGKRKGLDGHLLPETLHDPLTGLGNRVLFLDRIRRAVERSAVSPETLAVIVLDIDGFSEINDTFGHSAGDLLLTEFATRLQSMSRKGDTLARLGGDEFGILLERADADVPGAVAMRVLERLDEPFALFSREVFVTATAGVATGGVSALTAEDLLRSADLALGRAKASGRGSIEVFRPDMQAAARRKVEMESDLRRALEQDELVLYYQPIVELPSGRIAGAECLVRWNRPGMGLVGPSEFIAVAEESDLVINLGRRVLAEACRQVRVFQEAYATEPPFFLSVNVAPRQLLHPHLVDEVRDALLTTGIDPSTLVLELTESAVMPDDEVVVSTLGALKGLGVKLAIDDFGTGWSSLSRLRMFPIDKLKIDRPFISDISDGDAESPLLAAIVAMAHSLGMETIAEGVETVEQLAGVHRQGCTSAQGFGVYHPVPAEALTALLRDHARLLEVLPARPLSSEAQSYREVILDLTTARTALDDIVRPLLGQLLRVTGSDVAFLTEDDESHLAETVRFAVGNGQVRAYDGLVLALRGSPAEQARLGGRRVDNDLPARYPSHGLVTMANAVSYLGVPVVTPEGAIFGTLCVASASGDGFAHGSEDLVDLFARLVGDHPEVRSAPQAAPIS